MTPRTTSRRTRRERGALWSTRQAGVTLLEMLVVLTIVGLIIGVSMPSISAGIDSVRLRTAASSVASFLNAAVTRVDRFQQPMEVLILPGEGRIVAHSNEPGFVRELKLPDGIAIEGMQAAPGAQGNAMDLILLPGATAPGIGVQLVNRHGTRRVVKLDPITGYPRVGGADGK